MEAPFEDLIFHLGSLIYPKDILKCFISDYEAKTDNILEESKNNKLPPQKDINVIRLYRLLY